MSAQHSYNIFCVFQRVINATVAVHHMQRLKAAHAEPSVPPQMPSIEVMEVSSLEPPPDDLDTNGNPSCSNTSLSPQCDVSSGRGPLKACNSEPMHALVITETGEHTYHSESELHCAAHRYNDSLPVHIDSSFLTLLKMKPYKGLKDSSVSVCFSATGGRSQCLQTAVCSMM